MFFQVWIQSYIDKSIKPMVRVDAWRLGDEYVGESTWQDYDFNNLDDFYKSEQYDLMKLEAIEDLIRD